jgi:hypothetical protein
MLKRSWNSQEMKEMIKSMDMSTATSLRTSTKLFTKKLLKSKDRICCKNSNSSTEISIKILELFTFKNFKTDKGSTRHMRHKVSLESIMIINTAIHFSLPQLNHPSNNFLKEVCHCPINISKDSIHLMIKITSSSPLCLGKYNSKT